MKNLTILLTFCFVSFMMHSQPSFQMPLAPQIRDTDEKDTWSTPMNDLQKRTFGKTFLKHYGYLSDEDDVDQSEIQRKNQISRAILEFQQLFHLNATGRLDDATVELMQTPRCGEADVKIQGNRLKKRYTLEGMWQKRDLTYRFGTLTRDLLRVDVVTIIRKAIREWEKHAAISLTEVSSTDADIEILFGTDSATTSHLGPNLANWTKTQNAWEYSFVGNVLAHGFYPPTDGISPTEYPELFTGDVHINDAFNWVTPKCEAPGINLFWVALHELGHSLGLEHSFTRGAVMYPSYGGCNQDTKLSQDDIAGIQALYGPPTTENVSPTKTTNPVTTTTASATKSTTRSTTTKQPTTTTSTTTKQPTTTTSTTTKQPTTTSSTTTTPSTTTASTTTKSTTVSTTPRQTTQSTTTPTTSKQPTTTSLRTTVSTTESTTTMTPNQDEEDRPDICQTSDFDAVMAVNSDLHFFKGRYTWIQKNYRSSTRKFETTRPSLVSEAWPGLPTPVNTATAICYSSTLCYALFTKGSSVYTYSAVTGFQPRLQSGYPHDISVVFGTQTPSWFLGDIDAMVLTAFTNQPFMFLKGERYWIEGTGTNESPLNFQYPDAAFQWNFDYTWFFKGSTMFLYHLKNGNVVGHRNTKDYWFKNNCANAANLEMATIDGVLSTEPHDPLDNVKPFRTQKVMWRHRKSFSYGLNIGGLLAENSNEVDINIHDVNVPSKTSSKTDYLGNSATFTRGSQINILLILYTVYLRCM